MCLLHIARLDCVKLRYTDLEHDGRLYGGYRRYHLATSKRTIFSQIDGHETCNGYVTNAEALVEKPAAVRISIYKHRAAFEKARREMGSVSDLADAGVAVRVLE